MKTLKQPWTKEYKELTVWVNGKNDPEFIDIGMINAHPELLSEYIRE